MTNGHFHLQQLLTYTNYQPMCAGTMRKPNKKPEGIHTK